MIKTTIFQNIGFGPYAESEIEIEEHFATSNDYTSTYVYVDHDLTAGTNSTREAIERALCDNDTINFIIDHMHQ